VAWGGPVPGSRQIFLASSALLDISGTTEEPFTVDNFKVMTPDSRLRTKVTILFVGPGAFTLPSPFATLALIELEQDIGGPSGQLQPSVAIDPPAPGGTINLPLAPGLVGYSREFVTAGDAIQGTLVVAAGVGPIQVVISARWQPDGQRLPADEWDEVIRLCSIVAPQRYI
jgi:hypothetical protein